MPSINLWGPATWDFFHTTAYKIKENEFYKLGPQFFNFIVRICYNLPCPTCSEHAKAYIAKLMKNKSFLTKKQEFINALYIFHNEVNKRKTKSLFKYEELSIYANKNVLTTYNNFILYYNTDGDLTQINQNFHRKKIISDLKQWLISNIKQNSIEK